ncbi:MAG: tetratricopeptide repeat protein [Spirochaetota bacterium]|nr:tetratricopeptide repeat protein [Spirochaetota bacterium]
MPIHYLIIIGAIIIIAFIIVLIRSFFSSAKNETIQKLLQQKNYDSIIKLLKKLLQKNDNNSFAHFYLGESYFRLDNFEWALPHFRKVIKINKYTKDVDEVRTRERLAEIFLHFQQLEEAQKEFLMILKLKPDNYQYYYRVGEIFYQRHYKDNAAAYFVKALELNPSHVDSLFRMGEIHYDGKRPTDTLNNMNKCLKIDPGYHKAHYYLGMVYLDSKNYLQAIQEFEKSYVDSEYRLRSLYQKGRANIESGSTDKGILELERGLQYITSEDPASLALRYLLAQGYEKDRNITAAIEQWETISMTKPDYRDTKEKLAQYKDLRQNDQIKEFMTASDSRFEGMCRKIVDKLSLEVQELTIKRGSVASIITSERESEWRGVRKTKQYIRIYRVSEKLGDSVIREVIEVMKDTGAVKGICITSGEFSRQAIDYAATRPIELYDKDQLSKFLQ